jgi:hypothetical protein
VSGHKVERLFSKKERKIVIQAAKDAVAALYGNSLTPEQLATKDAQQKRVTDILDKVNDFAFAQIGTRSVRVMRWTIPQQMTNFCGCCGKDETKTSTAKLLTYQGRTLSGRLPC